MNIFNRYKLKNQKKRAEELYKRREQGENIELQDVTSAFVALAKTYDKLRFDKSLTNADLLATECYRTAGTSGDVNSQYEFAKRKLELGKFWDHYARSPLGRDIHQTYANAAYEEAINYLVEAEKSGHPLAMRLHGMVYIHGWGVVKNQERGLKLVVESIDRENAWDRWTEIFEGLGLNKPEFITSMTRIKRERG